MQHILASSDSTTSNWMRFVNCARNKEEQNLLASHHRGVVYYRTLKDVHPETELLVWCGGRCANNLGNESSQLLVS